jgi:hypothetical protein
MPSFSSKKAKPLSYFELSSSAELLFIKPLCPAESYWPGAGMLVVQMITQTLYPCREQQSTSHTPQCSPNELLGERRMCLTKRRFLRRLLCYVGEKGLFTQMVLGKCGESFATGSIPPTHLNPSSGRQLPRTMTPKSLQYKTRIWAMMLKHFRLMAGHETGVRGRVARLHPAVSCG